MPKKLPQEILRAAHVLWSFHRIDDEPAPADAIIGLGSYDLRVALRCVELYRAGHAERILFTGGSGNWTKGVFERPEADIFTDIAIDAGVPRTAILIERQASNIAENLAFARDLMPGLSCAILVTKPQTQKRVLAARLLQWPDVETTITAPQTGFADQPTAGHPIAMLIEEMVGDLARLIDYPARGYCAPVPITPEAMDAYRTLLAHGFTGHLPR